MCVASTNYSTIKPKQLRLMVKKMWVSHIRHTQGATNGVPTIALHNGFGRVPRESFPESVNFQKSTSTSQWNADHKPSIVEQNNKRWNLTCKENPRILMERQQLGDSLSSSWPSVNNSPLQCCFICFLNFAHSKVDIQWFSPFYYLQYYQLILTSDS